MHTGGEIYLGIAVFGFLSFVAGLVYASFTAPGTAPEKKIH